MNCADWNPIKLYKYKQYPERKKLNASDKLMEKMNHYKNSGIKDPFKE